MKKRLLAFFLAFALVFSLVPVTAFAAEGEVTPLYTGMTTESGENVTAEYVETVVGEAAWGQKINTPYYHVTVPEGTEKVLLTYPESVNLALSGDNSAGFFFRNTYPGQSTIDIGGDLPYVVNDDGSKTVTVPVENFLLNADGSSVAVGMMYYVDSDNLSAVEFFDFTYAAPTHAVTLTSGEGYTLTGEAAVEDGKDYTFTVTILDGYEMGDAFVVKANGTALTAGESGGYTVENVTADLTITVDGVVKQQPASHTVTLTSGDGYTLKGETTVANGADYTFSVEIAKYYGASSSFAVKANGTALTANEDGTYTVKNVTTDLTITVEGVTRFYKITLPHGWSQFTMSACDGYAAPSTDPSIARDGSYKFKVTPNEGFAVRDNDYGISFSGNFTGSVEVKDGYAVVTLTKIRSNGEVKIQGVKQIITVTLPEGEDCTVTPAEGTKTPVLKGDSYTFTVDVAEGYVKTDAFAVKANDEALTANEDGSYTIADISADQTITVEGVEKQAAGHTVTLTPGEGYTLTGEATAEDGKDYTFTVTVAEGFVKNGVFAVKANGTALKANEDGTYTVSAVAEDVTITVEGVMTPPANGLSALVFGAGSSLDTAAKYEFTPAFDPAAKEYTVQIPDSNAYIYAWATRDTVLSSKAKINVTYNSVADGKALKSTITSGSTTGRKLTNAIVADGVGNTLTITVTDGDYSDTYTMNVVRTDPTLKKLSLGTVKLDDTFKSANKAYTATTADESVTVTATPQSSDYTVTINGGTDNVVALEMGENVIEIAVQNARGDKNTYTVTVTRVKPVLVSFNVTPADAEILLTDSKENAVTPDSNGVYHLMADSTYTYLVKKVGYVRQGETFTATEDKTFTIQLKEAPHDPVTVYFSFSHDANFEYCSESGTTMALKKVTVPYFDLANYGMEGFYFHSESYGATDPDNPGQGSALTPGTAEYAFGKITMLHLFIYATEVYYCGIDPEDAGEGYLYDSGLLGTDLFSYSGSTGSIFLQTIWNYDLNLNYYLNHEYPLASEGWGSTCDQILLHDDDVVTLGHFTDWSFYSDSTSVFNHFEADNAAPVQGEKFTLSVIRDGADMSGNYTTGHYAVTYCPDIYCAPVDEINSGDVTTWKLVGKADAEGKLTVDTSNMAPGEYIFAMAGQPGAEYTDSICSTPGGMRVTIQAKPVVKGDVNGDGAVDTFDVTALYKAISNMEELDASVADVNGDGVVDVFDVMAVYDIIKNAE